MRILKRKKAGGIYYYLQHSYRSGGKVVTSEKYLGKKIPKNLEEIKQKLEKEISKALYGKLENIKKNFQAEWGKIPESAKERELQEIAIAFTYNTNAIEGSTITLAEVREIVQDKIAPNKPIRDVKEAEKHAKVFLKMLEDKRAISNELMLEWHRNIFGESKGDIAGRFRDYMVRVGPYIAMDWQEIKSAMNELVKFISENRENPVISAGIAHYRFEKIHPFGDGNGRIGRLLMNYILWHRRYPMLIIEYKKRKSYYRALQKGEDGFVDYFVRRYLAVHGKRIKSEIEKAKK